jgi:MFS family permease
MDSGGAWDDIYAITAPVRAALQPLRLAPFRRLSGAYAISRIGDTIALVALAIAVYDRTHSTVATTALFLALEFVPALAAPALTARLDRIPTGRVLPVIYTVEALIFCGLAALTHSFALAPFLALAIVEGVLGIVSRSLCRAAVAAVLEPAEQLREGNALVNMAIAPNMAIGGAVGAALVAGFGADAALLVNSATFVLGAVLIATAHDMPRYEAETDDDPEHWRVRLAAGVEFLRRNRKVLVLLLGQAAAFIFFALTEPIEVAYTRDALGAGAGGYGALICAWGVGVMLGSVIYAAVGTRRLGVTIALSTGVLGAAYAGLGAAPDIAAACAISIVGGAANGAQMVSAATAIQEAIPANFQARVMSVYESLITAAPGIGYMIGGTLGATLGGRAAFTVAGAGVFAVMLTVGLAWPRRARAPRVAAPRAQSSS